MNVVRPDEEPTTDLGKFARQIFPESLIIEGDSSPIGLWYMSKTSDPFDWEFTVSSLDLPTAPAQDESAATALRTASLRP